MVADPDRVERLDRPLTAAAGAARGDLDVEDASGAFLDALDIERRVMFIILSASSC